MTLDRSKKYEGLGFTWSLFRANDMPWKGTNDDGVHVDASHNAMQVWLDAGHITPVRTTKIVRVESVRMVWDGSTLRAFRWNSFEPSRLPAGAQSKLFDAEFEVEA
jgi:hypothetical protein